MGNMSNTKKILDDYMPTKKILLGIADFFNIFSDVTRIKMIITLTISQMCVNDLVELLGLNQSTISHQLKLLRDSNIVSYRREGKKLFYYISNQHVEDIMLTGVKNLE